MYTFKKTTLAYILWYDDIKPEHTVIICDVYGKNVYEQWTLYEFFGFSRISTFIIKNKN